MKPSIAIVAGMLSGGGAERQLLYLLRELVNSPIRLSVAALTPGDPGVASVEALGIPVACIPRSCWKIDRLLHLTGWLRRERPMLVHSWVFYGNIYAAWAGALAGVPVRLGSVREDVMNPSWNMAKQFLRMGLLVPDAIIVNSSAAAAAISERGPRGVRPIVVRNGLDLIALTTAAGAAAEDRRGRTVVALVGRLISLKNVPLFLRVIARLADRHPTIEGWIIGDGPERARLEALAAEMGLTRRVRFWGERRDVPALLAKADIYCHCSHTEGLSNAIMEASALGLPVVATCAGGTREIVEDQITGLVVPLDDEGRMVECVDKLICDRELRERLGSSGRRKMVEEFSVARMVRDMLGVYGHLLAEKIPEGTPLGSC